MKPFLAVITPVAMGGEHPDNTLPGAGSEGGAIPSHPIYYPDAKPDQGLPGEQPYPDQGLPGEQPHPDQGLPPFASHPIVIPPDTEVPPEVEEGLKNFEVKTGWTEETGWVVVLVPKGEVATPSKGRRK